jgi:acetoacetyl-CoA reductase
LLPNNAGVTLDAKFHELTLAQRNTVLRIEMGSMFNMCSEVICGMRERGFRRIINISSVNGLKGRVGQTSFSVAKAAVLEFARTLAPESASKGVTVTPIAQGCCDTQMVAAVRRDILARIVAQIPVGRLGRPQDIGRVVDFLASDASGFIRGATLSANGGMYMG